MLDTNWTEESLSNAEMWQAIGYLELHYGLPTLLQSSVTVDYKNISRNALYLDQVRCSDNLDFSNLVKKRLKICVNECIHHSGLQAAGSTYNFVHE